FGWVGDRYWEDVGTHESYLAAQADVLSGRVAADIDGFEVSPRVWVAEDAEVDPEAALPGPLVIGEYAKVEPGATLREYTVIGSNVVVKEGAFLHRAVLHSNVYVGQRLCEHAAEGLDRHHVQGRLPGRPHAQAGGAGGAQRQRDQRGRPGGPGAAGGQVRDRAQRLQRRHRAARRARRPAVHRPHLP